MSNHSWNGPLDVAPGRAESFASAGSSAPRVNWKPKLRAQVWSPIEPLVRISAYVLDKVKHARSARDPPKRVS